MKSKKHSCKNNACSRRSVMWQTDAIGFWKCDSGLPSHLLSLRPIIVRELSDTTSYYCSKPNGQNLTLVQILCFRALSIVLDDGQSPKRKYSFYTTLFINTTYQYYYMILFIKSNYLLNFPVKAN
jgi:hypothetical protein